MGMLLLHHVWMLSQEHPSAGLTETSGSCELESLSFTSWCLVWKLGADSTVCCEYPNVDFKISIGRISKHSGWISRKAIPHSGLLKRTKWILFVFFWSCLRCPPVSPPDGDVVQAACSRMCGAREHCCFHLWKVQSGIIWRVKVEKYRLMKSLVAQNCAVWYLRTLFFKCSYTQNLLSSLASCGLNHSMMGQHSSVTG